MSSSTVHPSGMSEVDMDTSISSPSSPIHLARTLPVSRTAEDHPHYHFHDGSITFELDKLKYCVHASLLARQCDFTSTWTADLHDPAVAGIPRADLDVFLAMMYTPAYRTQELAFTIEDWISLLRIATKWEAGGMRDAAIHALSFRVSPFDKLVISRAYNIPGWLPLAYAGLALHRAPFTAAETQTIGKDGLASILRARRAVSTGIIPAAEHAVALWLSKEVSVSLSPLLPSLSPGAPISRRIAAGTTPTSPIARQPSSGVSSPKSPKRAMSAEAPPFQPNALKIKRASLPTQAAAVSCTFMTSPEPYWTAEDAFARKKYDVAFSRLYAVTADTVAETVAPLFSNPKTGEVLLDDLLELCRAAIRRAIEQPGFIQTGAQFLASLRTRLDNVKLGILLNDDLMSLSSCWIACQAGAPPTPDRGGLMQNIDRGKDAYLSKISNGKEFFRALLRFSVVPADKDEGIRLVVK